jgi:hypothetical protein
MASTVKEQPEWKISNNGRRKREGEMLCIAGGRKGLVQVTLLPRGRVTSRQASWGVISDLWGDLTFKGSGAAFDGKRWAVAV